MTSMFELSWGNDKNVYRFYNIFKLVKTSLVFRAREILKLSFQLGYTAYCHYGR